MKSGVQLLHEIWILLYLIIADSLLDTIIDCAATHYVGTKNLYIRS